MPRSVRVHPDYRQTVAIALERNGFLTQGDLAAHLEIALSTVSNFFRGLNVSISKYEQICEALGLDTKTLIQPRNSQASTPPNPNQSAVNFYAYDAAWVGREPLIADLKQKVGGTCRLLLITGIAGIGKTALAERLFVELQDSWLQGRSNLFLRENFDNQDQSTDFGSVTARLLEKCGQVITPEERKNPQQLMHRLVRHLQDNRYLVVIDALERILIGKEQEGWSEFEDEGFVRFFQLILSVEAFQSRIILTSQDIPAQILEIGTRYHNFWFCQPLSGLSESEQLALFEKTGLDIKPESAGRCYLVRIGKAYEGHPLALRIIVGEIGSQPFYGNVVAYWHRYGHEIEDVEKAIAEAEAGKTVGAEDEWKLDRFTRTLRRNVRSRLEKTFVRLKQDAKTAYILLCEASVYRCPVPDEFWLSHLEDWDCDEEAQVAALDVLKDRYLVEDVVNSDRYLLKQHNLIRSVSLDHLKRLGELDE